MARITSWNPQVLLRPAVNAFPSAAIQTAQFARSIAPGPNTAKATKVTFTGGSGIGAGILTGGKSMRAILHAPGMGARIYPIVSGSRAGERVAASGSESFVFAGEEGETVVVKKIDHPGTPAHPYLNKAAAAFPTFYGAQASKRMPHRR